MKKILIILSLFVLLFPNIALAHGGQEKRSGSTLVILYSDPISPLVGEKVKMGFTFVKEDRDTRLKDLPVTLSVIDTFYGDATKDTQILESSLKTDTNGVVLFEYTFPKENFFDIELKFKDQEGQDQEVGFLLQTRSSFIGKLVSSSQLELFFGLVLLTQILHSLEELFTGFHKKWYLFKMPFKAFLTFEVVFNLIWVLVFLLKEITFRNTLMLFFMVLMFANAIQHLVWAGWDKKYVPGLATAPIHLILFLVFFFQAFS